MFIYKLKEKNICSLMKKTDLKELFCKLSQVQQIATWFISRGKSELL